MTTAKQLPDYTSQCPHCDHFPDSKPDNAAYWTCTCGHMYKYLLEMTFDGWIMWLEAEVDPSDPEVQARKHAMRFKD